MVTLPSTALERWRARFNLSPRSVLALVEEPDKFVVTVALRGEGSTSRFASFVVEKESWPSWWGRNEQFFEAEAPLWNGVDGIDLSDFPVMSSDCSDDTWLTPPSLQGAPSPRYGHTALWTGTEMIVWGGYDGLVYPMVGGRYDPTTDTWSTNLGNAPRGRIDHTAVWTGDRMIVWGGSDAAFGPVNTGAIFDPTRNEWTAISMQNAPSPRAGHTAVWTGSRMLVWGGTLDVSGASYDPITDSWADMTLLSAPLARRGHAAAWTGTAMVVWGGQEPGSPWDQIPTLISGGLYDPAIDAWASTSVQDVPSGRINFSAVWTGHRFVIWGGGPDAGPTGSGGRYDPVQDQWRSTSSIDAPSARWVEPGVWTGSHMIVWGGYGVENYNDGGRYDPIPDTWRATSAVGAPAPRLGHRAVWTGDLMLIWGGFDRDTFAMLPDGGVYCGCQASTYFRDADGDEWGDALVTTRSCMPPAGFTEASGDCDDSDATVWKTPEEVPALWFGDRSRLEWSPPLGLGSTSVAYDLIASSRPSDFTASSWCVATDTLATWCIDTLLPAAGSAIYYLVRATNACPAGEGSLGHSADLVTRNGRSCP